MIVLENVQKYFNKGKKNQIHVINNTSLKLENTGLVALLGASGSGKTTLLNVMGGLDTANKGKIFVNGQRLKKHQPNKIDKIRNLNIGYIFQDYKLIDNMSVFDNVAIVLKMVGIKNKKEIKKRVDYVLETLNIYRYRNRFAGMLSGGERQRVGIARAIVKDPNIIIADEPTGNLDSKNTLEIMNIIKSISKSRLVILVTHETELAKFYADRTIVVTDGVISADYKNTISEELDYRLENNIYLKDMRYNTASKIEGNDINVFSDTKTNLNIRIVVKNNNLYIENIGPEKVELISNNSSIELIDDHYKKIDKSIYEKYEFNFSKVIDHNIKKRYSSILNPLTLFTSGIKKILEYPFMKKVLLLGFMAASMFILFAVSRIAATLNVEDSDFVSVNKNYIRIENQNITVEDFLSYEAIPGVKYMLPGESLANFTFRFNTYLQTSDVMQSFGSSLSSSSLINESDLIFGRLPEKDNEIVLDKMVIDNMNENYNIAIQVGINDYKDYLDYPVFINNMKDFTVVGFTDLKSPSSYVMDDVMVNILSNNNEHSGGGSWFKSMMVVDTISSEGNPSNYLDYNLLKDTITLKKGKWPINNYEVVIDYNLRYSYAIGKKLPDKINNTKLKVVGYYTSKDNPNMYLVNNNMIKYNLILNNKGLVLVTEDKDAVISELQSKNLNAYSLYDKALKDYKNSNKENVNSILIVSNVIIIISLIEIFLMIRSSFLSRIKEIGIYRAIGVKKRDIYKMFLGEILAISSTASLGGIFLMWYVIYNIIKIPHIGNMFKINPLLAILSLAACYFFNIVIGLLPVRSVISKTPAQILSRHDVE